MRYDFPNIEIAIRRAIVRAKRRSQPMYIYKTVLGYHITFTEPLPHVPHIKVLVNNVLEHVSAISGKSV